MSAPSTSSNWRRMRTRIATRAGGFPRSRISPSSMRQSSEPTSSSARWEPVDALPPLGFDHARIVVDAVDRLRGKLWWSNIAVGLLPERFTMPQARRVFEFDQRRDPRTLELPKGARAVGPRACHRKARKGWAGTPGGDVRIRRAPTRLEPAPVTTTGDAAPPRLTGALKAVRMVHDTARLGATSERPVSGDVR